MDRLCSRCCPLTVSAAPADVYFPSKIQTGNLSLSLSFGTLLAMLEKCCRLRGGLIRWITTAARLPSVDKNVEENNQQGQSTDQVKAITLIWRHLWVKKTRLFSFSLSFQSAINDWDGCQRDRFDVQFVCLLVAFALSAVDFQPSVERQMIEHVPEIFFASTKGERKTHSRWVGRSH